MKKERNFKSFEVNKNDYIVINKTAISNYFFIGVFCLSLVVFIVLIGKSLSNMNVTTGDSINGNLVSYYNDEFLNITYPIPGGDWVLGEIDTSGIEETVKKSSGDDSYFSITQDSLTDEVLSTILFNEQGQEGFRQFMSFSYKPIVDYTGDEFIDYCSESFKRDIENSGEYKDYTLLSAVLDDSDGVLLKLSLVETIKTTNEDGSEVEKDALLYYTQYIKKVGKNMATITFGSIVEDTTVDIYLKYFLNNIIAEESEIK